MDTRTAEIHLSNLQKNLISGLDEVDRRLQLLRMLTPVLVRMVLGLLFAAPVAAAPSPKNLTVYRVTPHNYSGLTNMNSGDAAGDAYFALYELTFPLYCQQMPGDSSCTSTGILNIPNFNVYTQSVVEVDARMGLYSGCTPNADTGVFECDTYASPYDCWYNATGPSQERHSSFVEMFEGAPGCTRDAAGCRCKAWLQQSIGFYPCPECDRRATWHKQTPLWLQLETMASTLNGSWYSTRAEGECAPGQRVGVDCWWQEVEVQATVNATCLVNRLKNTIVANFPACFSGCPQPANATSDCWITCMLQSVNGAAGGEAHPLSREAIVRSFTGAFSTQGGCPRLPPPGQHVGK